MVFTFEDYNTIAHPRARKSGEVDSRAGVMAIKAVCNVVGDDTGRIPILLPPPYTWTGTRAGEIRSDPTSFTKTSTLLIGPKATPFTVHTSLLISQSPYFRAALTGPFAEASSNTITLDDIDVTHFSLLTAWLYTSAIPPPFKDGKPAYYTLLHLYSLADRLCFEGLRNAVVDCIAELADRTNSVLTPSDTRVLYAAIRDSAPLRDLVLDLFAFKKTDRLLESHVDAWHAGFLRDLVVLLKRPVEQAMQRHRLVMWNPQSWHVSRACENCRTVLPPRYGAVACEDCCVAFCTKCIDMGTAMAGWDDGRGKWEVAEEDLRSRRSGESVGSGRASGEVMDVGAGDSKEGLNKGRKWESCKPWRGSRCILYHEHAETERCGDVFMGR